MKDFLIYLGFALLSFAWLFASAGMNNELQQLISLEFVQQELIETTSYLFGYIISVWLFIILAICYRFFSDETKIENDSCPSFFSQVVSVIALVAIPLTFIIWKIISLI